MKLDAKLANHHILKSKKPLTDKCHIWSQVVSLNKKAFKPQGPDKSLRLQGTSGTDGIGVSVIKQNTSTNRRIADTGRQQSVTKDEYKIEHIEDLSQETLKIAADNCVLIDPGRRDLIYCMHETDISGHYESEVNPLRCPLCEANLQTFKTVPSPHPHKRTRMSIVTCHGLLRCNNNQCFEADNSEKMRLWNRDLAAVLNFRKILFSLRNTGKRPSVFERN